MATKKIVKLKKKVATKLGGKKAIAAKAVKAAKSTSKASKKLKTKPATKALAKKTAKSKTHAAKAKSSAKGKTSNVTAKPAVKTASKLKNAKDKKMASAKVAKSAVVTKKTAKAAAPVVAKKTRAAANYAQFFQPIDDRVLILRNAPSPVSSSGLILPDTALEKPNQGVVVAVGVGHRSKKGNLRPLDVKLGDEVMFAQYAGTSVELDGQDLLLLREEEILGVVAK